MLSENCRPLAKKDSVIVLFRGRFTHDATLFVTSHADVKPKRV